MVSVRSLCPHSPTSSRGFTLLEALVALTVMAAGLAAIGQLGFGALSAARRAENRLDLISVARAALVAPPDRGLSPSGVTSGRILQDRWRLTRLPFTGLAAGGPMKSGWAPQLLRLEVDDGAGGTMTLNTVRLRRGGS